MNKKSSVCGFGLIAFSVSLYLIQQAPLFHWRLSEFFVLLATACAFIGIALIIWGTHVIKEISDAFKNRKKNKSSNK